MPVCTVRRTEESVAQSKCTLSRKPERIVIKREPVWPSGKALGW